MRNALSTDALATPTALSFFSFASGHANLFESPLASQESSHTDTANKKTGEITPPVLLGDWQGGEITSCRVRDSLCRSSCRLWRLYRDLERFAANLGADGGEEEVHAAIRR